MALLESHLEHISYYAASIAEITFSPPKIFTNALLQSHDITDLIRDTGAHERALFSVPPPPPPAKAQDRSGNANRRNTTFNVNGPSSTSGGGANAVRAPRRNTAVAAVLGTELVDRIRKGGGGPVGTGLGYCQNETRDKQEVDVEILLEGAEKLCNVYPISGAAEKISALRHRYQRLTSSIEHYEIRVAEQTAQLSKINKPRDFDDEPAAPTANTGQESAFSSMTEDDLRREEEEIRELERRKQGLEDRVNSMGRDITGVLR